MAAYYNEMEPYAAEWLRNLIKHGLIADGEVDTRSIVDVPPDDLRDFTQCHFFAGIGGWSHALRLAGWPDDREIWTGSCPCQPFSVAGKGLGADDPRHLWPHYARLIAARRPSVVMGEQVAGAAGYGWLDGVRSDLARENYACGAVDIPACAVDAPHIRQRIYWVAANMGDANMPHGEGRRVPNGVYEKHNHANRRGSDCDMADADIADEGDGRVQRRGQQRGVGGDPSARDSRDMADTFESGCEWRSSPTGQQARLNAGVENGGSTFWSDAIWLTGADGKARRAKPGLPLLLDGLSAGMARLCAIEDRIAEEVNGYAKSIGRDATEALRMVRESLCAQAHDKRAAGGSWRVCEAQILLNLLLCVEAACDRAANGGGIPKTLQAPHLRIVRGVWDDGELVDPSRRWRTDEQQGEQPTDALPVVSLILAQHAQAHRKAAWEAHAASNRVGMLRAFGNAIVPQLAAEVIAALMETQP